MNLPRSLSLVLVLVLSLAFPACKSPEEKLVDRKRALRAALDRIYEAYRREGEPDAKDGGSTDLVGRIFGELDRAQLEQGCLAAGRGDRALDLSGRLDAFLKDSAHASACRDAADLELQIRALEREVAGRAR